MSSGDSGSWFPIWSMLLCIVISLQCASTEIAGAIRRVNVVCK